MSPQRTGDLKDVQIKIVVDRRGQVRLPEPHAPLHRGAKQKVLLRERVQVRHALERIAQRGIVRQREVRGALAHGHVNPLYVGQVDAGDDVVGVSCQRPACEQEWFKQGRCASSATATYPGRQAECRWTWRTPGIDTRSTARGRARRHRAQDPTCLRRTQTHPAPTEVE